MTTQPEPVEAYRLRDLPVGTKVKLSPNGGVLTVLGTYAKSPTLVEVVEWPQRTYDGIPADDLDAILLRLSALSRSQADLDAAARIRAAIEAQEQAK